ncbi:MAG: hypothetical protein DRH26_04580, partial [Deltaproteobacteria bacterium]
IYNDWGLVTSSTKRQYNNFPLDMEACKFTPILGLNYRLYIYNYNAIPQELMIIVGNNTFAKLEEYSPERTVNLGTPCANPDVISVGAVPYNNTAVIEEFSGQGPGKGDAIKPDIVAPDAVSTV